MMMEKVLSRSVRMICSGGMAVIGMSMLSQTAFAQDANIQRVEITGSSIKRATAETASPVQVIGRDELLKSGKATVAEYLQTLPVDGAGSLPTGFGSGFAAGSTAISLRGLGATSTLVLLNGRRMAPFARADDGQKSFTDLSTVPMQIVERIEVLKDGASSLYGADAIAGVVNIILRKDFTGLQVRGETGASRYSDAKQNKASLTYGQGTLDEDKYNWVINAEFNQSDELKASQRRDREWIGKGDLRPWGYANNTQYAGGWLTNGVGSPAPTGLLLNPATGQYVSLPGCDKFSTSRQDQANACLWHHDQFRAMQPKIDSINLYTRGTWQINADTQAYTEIGYSKRNTDFTMTPGGSSSTVVFPGQNGGPNQLINYGNAITMAANHPQNPYGVPVRVRYSAWDVGASTRSAENKFTRFVVGLKGTYAGWDYETGFTHSESKLGLEWSNMLNMRVLQAALGDPKSQFFPYYLGADAGKNSPALYNALRRTSTSDSSTKLSVIDFKASRELFALPGGNLGLAIGGEHRQEKLNNPSMSGTEDGSINGSYTAAFGDSKVSAIYAEVLAPVLKTVELTAALRYDHYDKFNSTTPKLGAKWTPLKTFALRGTFTKGFRAPSAAESNPLSQAVGSASVMDPVRCKGGVPMAGASSADCSLNVNAIKIGNPNLQPEKSKGYTLGIVWDPLPDTSLALDAWKIKRDNEINPVSYAEAAARPDVVRNDNNLKDAAGNVIPNTGTLLVLQGAYRNSSYTEVSGVDLDVKQRLRLGAWGKATIGLNWSHTASWLRVESESLKYQFAGTHGNCDTSNCAGTPKNKINLTGSWDIANWNFTATANYRDSMKNIRYEGATACASKLANGSDAPAGCKLASFTTVDLSARWNFSKQLQLTASVANLFDKVAPLDPLTYGGMSFNPMDNSGAVGRYFKVGANYTF
ncbi:TonB-dependent receptor [Massilia sp. erpn]|uniref:TonB-dependent receptor n=1 Tax=Massilia sp. erpn TaxID=2738142 RepID=UPI0021081737|nr:TonB-dependent receptor [Massilia sp. erpn]